VRLKVIGCLTHSDTLLPIRYGHGPALGGRALWPPAEKTYHQLRHVSVNRITQQDCLGRPFEATETRLQSGRIG